MDYIMDTKLFHSSLQMPHHLQIQGLLIYTKHLLPYFFISKVILQAYYNVLCFILPNAIDTWIFFVDFRLFPPKNNLLGMDWHGGNPQVLM
jgi:hypothetical protein